MTTRHSAAKARRVASAVNGYRAVVEVIGPIEPGMSLFAITRGQISMIDVLTYAIDQIGPCDASIWTWCIADYEVEAFEKLLAESRIRTADLVIDRMGERRNVELLDRWRGRFGPESVRVVQNHCKLATVSNDRFRLLIRGSMNLNFNPRFEQFDISEGDAAFELVREIEREIPVLPRLPSLHETVVASGLHASWTDNDLKPFEGIKPWSL